MTLLLFLFFGGGEGAGASESLGFKGLAGALRSPWVLQRSSQRPGSNILSENMCQWWQLEPLHVLCVYCYLFCHYLLVLFIVNRGLPTKKVFCLATIPRFGKNTKEVLSVGHDHGEQTKPSYSSCLAYNLLAFAYVGCASK